MDAKKHGKVSTILFLYSYRVYEIAQGKDIYLLVWCTPGR